MRPSTPRKTYRKNANSIANMTSTDPARMTPDQLELRNLVISTADLAFRQKGIKKVTMDEVSKNLRMSKRTLYQFFRDKEELVMACVKNNLDQEMAYATQVAARSTNVLEIMLGVTAYRINDFSSASDNYLREIQMFESVARYFKMRRTEVDNQFIELLNLGVEQGLFRPDIEYAVVVQSLAMLTDSVINREEATQHFTVEQFIRNVVVTLFRGCVTDKGREVIEQYRPPMPENL